MNRGCFVTVFFIASLSCTMVLSTGPQTLKDAKIEEHNERHDRKEPLIKQVEGFGNLPAQLTLDALDKITVDKKSPENRVPKRAHQAIAIAVSGAFTTLLSALTYLAGRECKNDLHTGHYGWIALYGPATLLAASLTTIVGSATIKHVFKACAREKK